MHGERQVMIRPHERRAFDAYVRAGVLEVVGKPVYRGEVLYATVRRNEVAPADHNRPAPAWVRPVAVAGGVAGVGLGVLALVAHLVRTMTTAVSQAGPALGFVLALAVSLLLAVTLRRRGRTVTVTTVTTTRVRVK